MKIEKTIDFRGNQSAQESHLIYENNYASNYVYYLVLLTIFSFYDHYCNVPYLKTITATIYKKSDK